MLARGTEGVQDLCLDGCMLDAARTLLCKGCGEGVVHVWSQVPQETGAGMRHGQLWARRTALCKQKVISSLVSLKTFLLPETSDTLLKELHVALPRAEVS